MKRIGILTAGDTPVLNTIIQPDLMLVPEIAPDLELLVERGQPLYDLPENVVKDGGGMRRPGLIPARKMHPSFNDAKRMKSSQLMDYLMPIFTDAIGEDDMEHRRRALFAAGTFSQPYHSINTDVLTRICHLEAN